MAGKLDALPQRSPALAGVGTGRPDCDAMTAVMDLADRYHAGWLAAHPFAASQYGLPGHDAEVPDESEEGHARRRSQVEQSLSEARALLAGGLEGDDELTAGCVVASAEGELDGLDSALVEMTVTSMPFQGPASLLALASRTVLPDARAAGDYLTRLRHAGGWIDQHTERLRAGSAKGRLPVAPLVARAISWAEAVLSDPVPAPLVAPTPPEGWGEAPRWLAERDLVAAEVVAPALARWAEGLRELLPRCRDAEHPGLVHLPGGDADYSRAIRVNTTLALTPEELHRRGLEEVARLEQRCLELGAAIGLSDLGSVHRALRASSAATDPSRAIAAAEAAVRRAEARMGEVFPPPPSPPCAVTPMPHAVAASGAAPHYSSPRLDGSRPGTYWFNLERPTAGSGWDLEGVAFHEAVPGHHLQLSRVQLLGSLPAFLRQRSYTVFAEGWGLYAEMLAEEIGLYSGPEALLGAMANALMRGARLVVDTGMHALGWSRAQALGYFVAHVPMPEGFLADEIDRYIFWPGQALGYLTGKQRITALREQARSGLGARFDLPGFHSAILDHGSLPMPVLDKAVSAWIGRGGGGARIVGER